MILFKSAWRRGLPLFSGILLDGGALSLMPLMSMFPMSIPFIPPLSISIPFIPDISPFSLWVRGSASTTVTSWRPGARAGSVTVTVEAEAVVMRTIRPST